MRTSLLKPVSKIFGVVDFGSGLGSRSIVVMPGSVGILVTSRL